MVETDDMSTLETRVMVPEQVVVRELAGEAVVLELTTGRYYGLDEVGVRMWSLLEQHGAIGRAYEDLLREFEVPREQLRRDLLEFVDLLASKNLLEIQDE